MATFSHKNDIKNLDSIVEQTKVKISALGNKKHTTIEEQLFILEELTKFELGRFLITAKGLNGYWTDYILNYPTRGKITGKSSDGSPLTRMEKFMLDSSPTINATQERYLKFIKHNQLAVKDNAILASLPCGLLGELFHLDFSIAKNVEIYAIDIDGESINLTKEKADKTKFPVKINYICENVFNLKIENKFDLISSNGLNIYLEDLNQIKEMYKIFFKALKNGGKLVTSYIEKSPLETGKSTWKIANKEHQRLSTVAYTDVIGVMWANTRSKEEMFSVLKEAGFSNIILDYDTQGIFPTLIAQKLS